MPDRGPESRPEPWAPGDVTNVVWTGLVGLIGLLGGWMAASGTVRVSTQMVWAAVAVVAVGVAGLGNGMWLAAGARHVRRRRERLMGRLDGLAGEPLPSPAGPPAAGAIRPVAVTGTHRYHDPACLLVAGKPVVDGDPESHESEGRRPCEACLNRSVAAGQS